MARTIAITAAVTAVLVAALIAAGVLLWPHGEATDRAKQEQAGASSQPVAAPAAVPTPTSIVQGSPQWDEMLVCLNSTGYSKPKADVGASQLVIRGADPDIPELRFNVSTSGGQTRLWPASAGVIAVLKTAGCLV